MQKRGRISVRGIVQGVGFRPFVYARACEFGIAGSVKNLGSEVEIYARGERFTEFLAAVSRGPPMSRIDSVDVTETTADIADGFVIKKSGTGSFSGMIPPDIAICDDCIADIFTPGGRYEGYWATSCVNCGPRYSIIQEIPYDRERTSMDTFPMCPACGGEYGDPHSRRHHAQTIACHTCGPGLRLMDKTGTDVPCSDPIREAAALLDAGKILAIRGVGGFHLACIEESSGELKSRLGRIEQPFAVMVRPGFIDQIALVSQDERELLESPVHPIVVLEKRDHASHHTISNLHTIGCMLPYTGLHHLLFSHLRHPLLIMTSANMPGYPMITDTCVALVKLAQDADYFLVHNRTIANRVDDSVIRDGYILRLSRGMAPKRTAIDLGPRGILGVGPELNANATIYKNGFAVTSPHVGNVRNPATLEYLQETIAKLSRLLGARYELVAHDLHPQFLSTRFAGRSRPSRESNLCRSSTTWRILQQRRRSPVSGSRSTASGTGTTERSGAAKSSPGRYRTLPGLPISNPWQCREATLPPGSRSGCCTASCRRRSASTSSATAAGQMSKPACSENRSQHISMSR